jgi:hypothetical protein
MREPINPRVVDLSHWNPANDYDAVKDAGIVGVIYKATEGVSYTDNTYVQQQHAAKAAGLKWGAYHLANGRVVDGQVANFLRFAATDPVGDVQPAARGDRPEAPRQGRHAGRRPHHRLRGEAGDYRRGRR